MLGFLDIRKANGSVSRKQEKKTTHFSQGQEGLSIGKKPTRNRLVRSTEFRPNRQSLYHRKKTIISERPREFLCPTGQSQENEDHDGKIGRMRAKTV